jgi:UBX domain
MMFYEGDLQSGIALAVQQAKVVLCFVRDESSTSEQWEAVLSDIAELVKTETVALRLNAGSQEAGFLSSFCPLKSVPTVVSVKNGVVQLHLWAEGQGSVTPEQLKIELEGALRKDVGVCTSEQTLSATTAASNINLTPPAPNVNSTPTVSSITPRSPAPNPATNSQPRLTPPANAIASNPPAQSIPPSSTASQAQQSQRADYIKMQKEREQKQRDERERIRQQIKSDREERRRREELRKQPQAQAVDVTGNMSPTPTAPKSHDIRVQVRTFDGSTLRQTFTSSANISSDIRPWIDSTSLQSIPYNLKIILTPLPNRNIEAAEEEQSLVDLGIKGSCTLVMVPVKGYVESYTGSTTGGLLGSAVSGGYNVVAGTAGAVLGGVKSFFGWNSPASTTEPDTGSINGGNQNDPGQPTQNVRVRTLADQRIDAAKKKDQQFYNGNQLNFEPRKEEGKDD